MLKDLLLYLLGGLRIDFQNSATDFYPPQSAIDKLKPQHVESPIEHVSVAVHRLTEWLNNLALNTIVYLVSLLLHHLPQQPIKLPQGGSYQDSLIQFGESEVEYKGLTSEVEKQSNVYNLDTGDVVGVKKIKKRNKENLGREIPMSEPVDAVTAKKMEEERVKRERDILINKRKFLESQLKTFRNQNQKVDENKDVYGFPHLDLPNDNLYGNIESNSFFIFKKYNLCIFIFAINLS